MASDEELERDVQRQGLALSVLEMFVNAKEMLRRNLILLN